MLVLHLQFQNLGHVVLNLVVSRGPHAVDVVDVSFLHNVVFLEQLLNLLGVVEALLVPLSCVLQRVLLHHLVGLSRPSDEILL